MWNNEYSISREFGFMENNMEIISKINLKISKMNWIIFVVRIYHENADRKFIGTTHETGKKTQKTGWKMKIFRNIQKKRHTSIQKILWNSNDFYSENPFIFRTILSIDKIFFDPSRIQ